MNLKPSIRYQFRDYVLSILTFLGVNLLILIGVLAGVLSFRMGDNPNISYSGFSMACAIFLFVYGIVLPRQVTRLCVQLGICRRTAFLSLFPALLLAALVLALMGQGLLVLFQQVSLHFGAGPIFTDLFSLIYLDGAVQLSLAQHGMAVLFNMLYMLAGFCLGLFFTFLFWRLNKVGCIIAALAIPFVLAGIPALMGLFPTVFAPAVRLLAFLGTLYISSPWWGMACALIFALFFALVSWMLIRRTNIRGGSLSK